MIGVAAILVLYTHHDLLFNIRPKISSDKAEDVITSIYTNKHTYFITKASGPLIECLKCKKKQENARYPDADTQFVRDSQLSTSDLLDSG